MKSPLYKNSPGYLIHVVKRRSLRIIILISVLVAIMASCKKFILVDPPRNQIVSSSVFADDSTATSSILGIYIGLMQGSGSALLNFSNGGISIYGGLSADELISLRPQILPDEVEFNNNSISPIDNTTNQYKIWRAAYQIIYQANACIEGLNNSGTIGSSLKYQLIGEAKVIRALCYFYLVNLYGDVPLVLTTDYSVNAVLPRTPASEIYQQLVTDLRDAENRLGSAYVTPEKVRINKWAAAALLSRVYLFQKDWSNAELMASAVIDSGNYNLEPDLNNVFLKNSNETIWQLKPLGTIIYTTEGFAFVPHSAADAPYYSITQSLNASFEIGDQRSTAWIQSQIIDTNTYYYPNKYKLFPLGSEYNIVFRLAEQFLIRAEARAQTNNISGAQADVNIIRNRAGLPNTTANDPNTIQVVILHERQSELFTEWGSRWLDLKRTGNSENVLGTEKPGWKISAELFPIPYYELQTNPNMQQNPGY